ncbi:hypothetical protein LCGC14_0364390 [marine sediment metagenome]|uniref:Uncharacterized protein n=1 Tax=marine sediment metagenome TaxID=412755 RepID=A0A0F9WFM3_9ZZZZ
MEPKTKKSTRAQAIKDAYSEGFLVGSQETSVLGPLQPIWDAWRKHDEFIDGIPNIYFQTVIAIQFNEIDDHVEAGHPPEKIDNEIVDVMSICLNWLRSRGKDDKGVAAAIEARLTRYADTQGIIDKYAREYGL